MTKLSVNINKVALLRNTRHLDIPSVIKAAATALDNGAGGVTVHPRPDERHIRPADVDDIALLLARPAYGDAELNIEGNPFEGRYMDIIERAGPTQCTLVPDDPQAFTSDHGWDLARDAERLKPIIDQLKSWGCRVSLFMDPDLQQISLAPATGADRIELYTEGYAREYAREYARAYSQGGDDLEQVFQAFAQAAALAGKLGLGVNAGHDLNLDNLAHFVTIPGILEVSIGHALIGDALDMGLAAAVKAYLHQLRM